MSVSTGTEAAHAGPQPQRIKATVLIDLGTYSANTVSNAVSGTATSREPHTRFDSGHAKRFAERRLAGQPLAVRMARRLSECQWIGDIFAVGCNLPASVLREHRAVLQPISLPCCHVIERLGAVADRTDADWVVYVPANRPFVDPGLIDGLIAKAHRADQCDYAGYISESAGHHRMSHLGLAGEVCHADMIRRLRRNADRLDDHETIADCVATAPGDYRCHFIPIPQRLDREDLRFAIEDESDWDDAELLCDSVSDVDAEWQRVAELVFANERLRTGMQDRNG